MCTFLLSTTSGAAVHPTLASRAFPATLAAVVADLRVSLAPDEAGLSVLIGPGLSTPELSEHAAEPAAADAIDEVSATAWSCHCHRLDRLTQPGDGAPRNLYGLLMRGGRPVTPTPTAPAWRLGETRSVGRTTFGTVGVAL